VAQNSCTAPGMPTRHRTDDLGSPSTTFPAVFAARKGMVCISSPVSTICSMRTCVGSAAPIGDSFGYAA
jgi:hypothetical protein